MFPLILTVLSREKSTPVRIPMFVYRGEHAKRHPETDGPLLELLDFEHSGTV